MKIRDKMFNELKEKKLNNLCDFALFLYHNGFLDKEWKISEINLKTKFLQFCKDKEILFDYKKSQNIKSLLRHAKLLEKIKLNSLDLILNSSQIYKYEFSILQKLDSEQIRKKEERTLFHQINDQNSDDYKTKCDSEFEVLEFQSCVKTKKNNEFVSTNYACYICQQNFDNSPKVFQEHVRIHNDMTNFEWLKMNPSELDPNFQVFYQNCKKKYYLKITLKTKKLNIKIERVLTINSDSFTTIKRKDEENDILKNGICSFIVDIHVLKEDGEQPLVIIYRLEDINEIFVEHYLICLKKLTSSDDHIWPEYISKAVPRRLECFNKFTLKNYYPEQRLKTLYSNKNKLMMYNDFTKEYFNNGKKLSHSNITEILKFLINLEDIETQNIYGKFTQCSTTVKGYGRDFFRLS